MPQIFQSGPELSSRDAAPALPFRKLCIVPLAALLLLAGSYASGQQPQYAQQLPYGEQQYGYGYGSQSPQPGYAQPQYPQQPYSQQPQYGQQQPYGAPYQPSPEQSYPAQGQPYDSQPYANQPYNNQPYGDQPYAQPMQPTQAPLSPDQLEQLLAPIALYPDALLAQVLAASTYPAQVAVADQWLRQMQAQGYGSPDQVAAGADSQSWDPSVKALTATPQVLALLDHNLQWTTQLGNAYFNQPQDVMDTVQALRQRAQNSGNLETTPQETVSDDQGAIELAPPSPEVVYVPSYNPWAVYGAPIAPYPGFSFLDALGSFLGNGRQFGAGIAMNAFDQTPFGWIGWGLNWLAHAVFFNHSTYFTHSGTVADWGFPHGGPRAYGGGWGRGYGHDARFGAYARGEYGRGSYAARGGIQGYGRENGFGRGGAYSRGDTFASNGAYGREGQFNRGYAAPAYNYGRSGSGRSDFGRSGYGQAGQQAYNRPYSGAYGGGAYGRYGYGYAARGQSSAGRYAAPGRSYGSPYSSYRAPQSSFQRAYAQAPSRSFGQSGRSGGFFSRGSRDRGFGRAPKGYSGGHSFFGGHSSGGFKAPRGGGNHFGGGGHFGGGHSGGGHKHW